MYTADTKSYVNFANNLSAYKLCTISASQRRRRVILRGERSVCNVPITLFRNVQVHVIRYAAVRWLFQGVCNYILSRWGICHVPSSWKSLRASRNIPRVLYVISELLCNAFLNNCVVYRVRVCVCVRDAVFTWIIIKMRGCE